MNERIAEIKKALEQNGWSLETLRIWRRAGYRCEYCGKDMRSHSDLFYRYSHLDHINPKRVDRDHFDNLALACAACNYIKRATFNWDPHLPREQMIIAVKGYIDEKRKDKEVRLAKDREHLIELDKLDPRGWEVG